MVGSCRRETPSGSECPNSVTPLPLWELRFPSSEENSLSSRTSTGATSTCPTSVVRTSEHAYQALKADLEETWQAILPAEPPEEAHVSADC